MRRSIESETLLVSFQSMAFPGAESCNDSLVNQLVKKSAATGNEKTCQFVDMNL